jgi:hypothetical protein
VGPGIAAEARLDLAELRLVGLDDPISIVLGVGGLAILLAGLVSAGLLRHLVGRRLIVMGAAMLVGALVYTLVASWLAPAA